MENIKVYTDLEIEVGRYRTKKKLEEFPELWGLRQDWGPHGWQDIKAIRAPVINFLEIGIRPLPEAKSIKVYLATHGPSLEDVADGIEAIYIHGVRYTVGAADGVALQRITYSHLAFGDHAQQTHRIFIVEKGGNPHWRVRVIKPPAGQKNFATYIKKLDGF